MIIKMDGREYDYQPARISLRQGVEIFETYGFTIDAYNDALEKTDPRALHCAYWVMLGQAGDVGSLKGTDADTFTFLNAINAATGPDDKPEPEPEPEPDPTSQTGSVASGAPVSPMTTTPSSNRREAVSSTVS